MSFTIQQALTPTVDALVEAAKDKLRSEFESEATHSAFAPGKKMTPRFPFKVARLDNLSEVRVPSC